MNSNNWLDNVITGILLLFLTYDDQTFVIKSVERFTFICYKKISIV
jgi:hypothetical protein